MPSKSVTLGDTKIDYVVFGRGAKPLVILPGLADGIQTVRAKALLLAFFYRKYGRHFRVYVFSRKRLLPEGYSTKEMAQDQKIVLEKLGIKKYYLMGISQGGMIAQHLAIISPEAVERLVLAVTVPRVNDLLVKSINAWVEMVEKGQSANLLVDTFENIYTAKRLKRYRPFYPLLRRVGQLKDPKRFLIQAYSCLTHDSYEDLGQIIAPTLILGAANDRVLGVAGSKEMAEKIAHSRLSVYKEMGHAVYEESDAFNREVITFYLEEE